MTVEPSLGSVPRMTDGRVRAVQGADLMTALTVASNCFGPAGARSLVYCYQAAPQLTFCCEAASEIVGVCFGYSSLTGDATVILEGLAVTAAWRGRGVGVRMLAYFEDTARETGYACVQLGTVEGAVSQFYLRRGYQIAIANEQCQAAKHIILFKAITLPDF